MGWKNTSANSHTKPPTHRKPSLTPRLHQTGKASLTPRNDERLQKERLEDYDSPAGSGVESMCSSSLLETHSLCWDEEVDSEGSDDTVKVLVRIRPATIQEAAGGVCAGKSSSKTVFLRQPGHDAQTWSFDYVAGEETTQDEMFAVAGQPIVEHCIAGYNSSIFAYGQTGAGKTYTMQGSLHEVDERGLSPRVFEWLFRRIAEEESSVGGGDLRYSCRCSFLEIYNETITDLLNPSATNLQLREDATRGCFVDGLSEEIVLNVEDASALMRKGAQNRKIGQTRMNHESSRSHSVFTCTIESTSRSEAGITNIRFSRLNLVDLAGSERNKASGATGEQFKEACLINQSLTALGRVIMELVDAQRHRKRSHIPYRDSRLTFLLQDSLGGNAKSMIIANISPALGSCQETSSTLHFVSRAKQIRNKAKVNQDTQAMSMEVLKRELQRLYRELELVRSSTQEPLVNEVASLTAQLEEARKQAGSARLAASTAASEAKLARTGAHWAEERVARLEREKAGQQEAMANILASFGIPCPAAADIALAEQMAIVQERTLEVVSRLKHAEEARDQAQATCSDFSDRIQSLQSSTSKIEEAQAQMEASSQSQIARYTHRLGELEQRNAELCECLGEKDHQHQAVMLAKDQETERRLKLLDARRVEELLERETVMHAERLAREEAIQELASERNSLQASLATLQAEVLAANQSNAELEQRVSAQMQAVEADKAYREEAEKQAKAEALAMTEIMQERQRQHQSHQEELQQALNNQLNQVHNLEAAATSLRQEVEETRDARMLAERQVADLLKERASLQEKSEALNSQLEISQLQHAAALQELDKLQKELRSESSRKEAASQSMRILEQQLEHEQGAATERLKDAVSLHRTQAATIAELQVENRTIAASLSKSRQEEADALLKVARFKHMLGDIDNIIKWARSPNSNSTAGGFRRGESLPSPIGNNNPLFIAHRQAANLSQSQEWTQRGGLLDPKTPGESLVDDSGSVLKAPWKNVTEESVKTDSNLRPSPAGLRVEVAED